MIKTDPTPSVSSVEAPRGGPAFLGPSFLCTGQITAQEDLAIQGTFKGIIRLKNHKLTVAKSAQVEADIIAGDVALFGQLTGNIRASGTVVLSAEAKMKGDITAPKVSIHDGAQFRGLIRMDKGTS